MSKYNTLKTESLYGALTAGGGIPNISLPEGVRLFTEADVYEFSGQSIQGESIYTVKIVDPEGLLALDGSMSIGTYSFRSNDYNYMLFTNFEENMMLSIVKSYEGERPDFSNDDIFKNFMTGFFVMTMKVN